MKQGRSIEVKGVTIRTAEHATEDFISLTDMASGSNRPALVIANWLRNRDTIEFLGLWEQLFNPDFKVLEFEDIFNQTGSNRFALSPQDWIQRTNAIGLVSKSGRGGGTYGHRDIAFEFGAYISPAFKLLLIREFQRMKQQELAGSNQDWEVRRLLSKVNYGLHAHFVKTELIERWDVEKTAEALVYASEADLLNLALFGRTAKQWREENPALAAKNLNIRDAASLHELTVLSNLESYNSILLRNGVSKEMRLQELHRTARQQLQVFEEMNQFALEKLKSPRLLP
ncbi:MAG: KilA-N domain-containing protein [Saprospiraceae bacterium]